MSRYANLTADELLQIADIDASTDLERALVRHLAMAHDSAIDLMGELYGCETMLNEALQKTNRLTQKLSSIAGKAFSHGGKAESYPADCIVISINELQSILNEGGAS